MGNEIRVAALAGENGHEEVLTLPSPIVKRWRYGCDVLQGDMDKHTNTIKEALKKGFEGHTESLPEKARLIVEDVLAEGKKNDRNGGQKPKTVSRQRLLTLLAALPPDHQAVVPLQDRANRTTRIDWQHRGLDRRT